MKLLYLALPLLSSLAIAQSLAEDDCQCPQVKCPSTDTFEGCRCVNLAELRCKKQCPTYKPTKFKICSLPQQPSTAPTSTPTPVPLPLPLPPAVDVPVLAEPEPGSSPSSLPPILSIPVPVIPVPLPAPAAPPNAVLPDRPPAPGCVCEQMMCIQSYPNSCHCEYGIAKNCYDKCGGKSPGPNTCPPLGSVGSPSLFDGPVKRVASPEPQASTSLIPVDLPVNVPASPQRPPSTGISSASCKCEERFCIQSFPASCHCANRNKNRCWMKCGGPKPLLQNCLAPAIPPKVPTETGGTHQVCGGGRANSLQCPTGYICMNDPFKSGCGLECDGTGICVQDQLCGGFAGFKCPNSGQVCVDRPDDGCDPKNGGADCGGVCVWPPSLRTG